MIAERNMCIDDKWYAKGETIFDLGDLDRADSGKDGLKHYYIGKTATSANFPHYVATGSIIDILGADGTTRYIYHAPSDTWTVWGKIEVS